MEGDMRHVKTTLFVAASLVLTVLLGLAGCGEGHGDHYGGDRDREPARYDRHDSDRHDDRGGDSGHDRSEHGDR